MFTRCFYRKEKENENRKETKGKKDYHSYHHLLGYYLKQRFVLLVSAIICRPDFPCFSQHTHPHLCSIAWVGISLSVRPVDQQRMQLVVNFCSQQYNVRSGVGVSARRIGSAMNRFNTKQTKIFGQKKIDFLKKNPKKLFVAQKINLEDTLIYGGG